MTFCALGFSTICFAKDINKAEYKKVRKQIKKKSLNKLEKKAHENEQGDLLRAIQATRALQQKYKHPGIKKKKFLQAAYYIERHHSHIKHYSKNHYLTKKQTGLKNVIEHDPSTGHTFIVMDTKKAFIGKGAKKKVYKAIHYMQSPKVLARCEQRKMETEHKAHRDLQGSPGIMNAHALTKHKLKKKKYHTIYSDVYEGTLKDLYKKKITFRNKLIIMSDLLQGLHSLHSRNYVHRDLHTYNYLYHTEHQLNGQKIYRAVITDLGRTIKIHKAKKMRAQMTRRFCPPEGFKYTKMKGSDYFASDIYALGCIFHRLHHDKFPRWQKEYRGAAANSDGKKKTILTQNLNRYTTKRRNQLIHRKHKNGNLSIEQDTELFILNMLNIDPAKRGNTAHLRNEVHHLLNRCP